MRFVYSLVSETGLVRKQNEDAILALSNENAGLFLVADGMGGLGKGGEASAKLRDAFSTLWNYDIVPNLNCMTLREASNILTNRLCQVNSELVERYGDNIIGSTLVLLFALGSSCAYLSCGDSRIYRSRGFSLEQMTQDDTVENRIVEVEEMEDATALVAAVGLNHAISYSLATDTLKSGDLFLLCSDGVYRFIPFSVLRTILMIGGKCVSTDYIKHKITKRIQAAGAKDNYSMIVVKILKDTASG